MKVYSILLFAAIAALAFSCKKVETGEDKIAHDWLLYRIIDGADTTLYHDTLNIFFNIDANGTFDADSMLGEPHGNWFLYDDDSQLKTTGLYITTLYGVVKIEDEMVLTDVNGKWLYFKK